MDKKIVGIFTCMLLICSFSSTNAINISIKKNDIKDLIIDTIFIDDNIFEKRTFCPTDDTFISHRDIDAKNGLATQLKIRNEYGADGSGWADISLIKFDISSIPSDSKIISAKLELYYIDYWDTIPIGREIKLYRINDDWDENTVTWDTQPRYSDNPSASSLVPSSIGQWMSWDITNDINLFIKGIRNNYGWKISDDNLWGYPCIPITYFYSKEYGTFSPKINITIYNSKDKPYDQVLELSKPNSNKNFRNNFDLDTKGYYFCKVDISGVGEYHDEVPIFIGWNLTGGQLKIKSMFSASSNFPNFPYKLFDQYNTSEPTNGILMLFIGTKTNEPFEIHGFAALAIIN